MLILWFQLTTIEDQAVKDNFKMPIGWHGENPLMHKINCTYHVFGNILPPVQNFAQASPPSLHPVSHLLVAKAARRRRVTIHLIPPWLLVFSLSGWYWKRGFPAFPLSKAPSGEAPGRYFIQGTPNFVLRSHTQACTYKPQFLWKRTSFVLYSRLAAAARVFTFGWMVLF